MARLSRIVLPGYPHHVTQRGVRSMAVFHSQEDRIRYLQYLSQQSKKYGLTFLDYCLMINHVHLIVIPKEKDSLAQGLGEAHRRYTLHKNLTQGVKGYLFQGRFFSTPLDERHLLAAVRYVEQNPVRAGMVRKPWDYPWSCARFFMGIERSNPLVKDRGLLGLIDDWEEYLLSHPEEIDALRKNTKTGRICGDEEFLLKAEKVTGKRLRKLPPGPKPKRE